LILGKRHGAARRRIDMLDKGEATDQIEKEKEEERQIFVIASMEKCASVTQL
jgi:hypothetical protein